MKKFTISAAAIFAVAALASVPANAEHNAGGPIVKGDQCFTYMKGSGHDARFGTWGACPQRASATTTTNGRGRNAAARPGAAPAGGAVQFEQHQQGYWGN